MRRILCFIFAGSVLLSAASSRAGIPYYPDRVPAATLIVPFFETGIDVATTPDDTLLSVANRVNASRIIHYTVWDVLGRIAFSGNVTLAPRAHWSAAMRDLVNSRVGAVRNQLEVDHLVYRGFVTIDVVTAATSLDPRRLDYPSSPANDIEGSIYYTRLAKGSANGLGMLPLEAFTRTKYSEYQGFYREGDLREQISNRARKCAQSVLTEFSCGFGFTISSLENRLFGSTALNGHTRLIVFMWNPRVEAAGPTDYCLRSPDWPGCETNGTVYPMTIHYESGSQSSSMIPLPNVVNVIDLPDPNSGHVRIERIPDYHQLPYTFAFNSAYPGDNPALTWDAVFEGFILP